MIQRGGAVAISLFQLVELAQLAGLVPAEDDDASTVPLAITGASVILKPCMTEIYLHPLAITGI